MWLASEIMQNQVQHHRAYVRSQPNQRSTCYHRAKVPRSSAAGRVRSLRVSIGLYYPLLLSSHVRLRSVNTNGMISIEIHRDPLASRIDSNVAQRAEQV